MRKVRILSLPREVGIPILRNTNALIYMFIQWTRVITTSFISNNHLFRSEILVPVKHENLATGNKILWKRRESPPPFFFFFFFFVLLFFTIFSVYLLLQKSNCIFICEMWLFNLFFFPLILQIRYVEIRLCRGILESPLDFEITRVDCSEIPYHITKTRQYNFDPLKPHFYMVNLGFTGVYTIFVISAQKHRVCVLVRTASSRRF